MGKFDTQGGYFAPQGYFRINEGGSHDENPNGGIQVGVDPQGVPNMLEQDEPVYDDYVFSDNIKADGEILRQMNLPSKYAGKLYSDIADDLVSEAEQRPNDAISNNGLRQMMSRLSDAQEEQKRVEQQKELEKELASLSPEELAQLEALLAQSAQEQAVSEQMPMEAVPQEQMPVQEAPMPVEGMPGMARGGCIRRFDAGGDKDRQNLFTRLTLGAMMADAPAVAAASGWTYDSDGNIVQTDQDIEGARALRSSLAEISTLPLTEMGAGLLMEAAPSAGAVKEAINAARKERIVGKAMDAAYKAAEAKKGTGSFWKAVANPLYGAGKQTAKAMQGVTPWLRIPATGAAQIGQWGANTGVLKGIDAAFDTWRTPFPDDSRNREKSEPELDFGDWDYANGGRMNRYAIGGWADFLKALNDYSVSRNPGATAGKYRIDNNFDLNGYKSIKDLEASDGYRNFTDYVINNAGNEDVLNYLRALDAGTASNVQKLFDGDSLREGWADIYRHRREDGLGGIYHFTPNDNYIKLLTNAVSPIRKNEALNTLLAQAGNVQAPAPAQKPVGIDEWIASRPKYQQAPQAGRVIPRYPTWPRYAGAINSGLLGLYNAFQEPDRYVLPRYNPVLPYGTMDLRDPVYNPIDEELAVNNVLASSAGTARALRNSGLGTSLPASLIALDNNTGRNLGAARTSVWDANNQQRNAITGQHNANAQAIGNFDYGISRDRAQMLNDAKVRNLQNDLMLQRLNYMSEGEKYAALSSQIDQLGQALAGIGRENFAMNQINGDTAFDYVTLPDGRTAYIPKTVNVGKCGGTLLRTPKKK